LVEVIRLKGLDSGENEKVEGEEFQDEADGKQGLVGLGWKQKANHQRLDAGLLWGPS
jgi:hypothetical protein